MKPEIIIFLPLPCQYGDQLIKSLHARSRFFKNFGVHVPDPKTYSHKLSHFSTSDDTRIFTSTGRKFFLDIMEARLHKRIVLSLQREYIWQQDPGNDFELLPKLNLIADRLSSFFDGWSLKFALGIVNFGRIISMKHNLPTKNSIEYFELSSLSLPFWSDALCALIDEFPDVKIEIWKHEYAYFQWPEILRRIGNVPDGVAIPASLDMVEKYLNAGARFDLRDHIRRLPPQNDYHFSKVIRTCNESKSIMRKIARGDGLKALPSNAMTLFDKSYVEDIHILKNETRLFLFDF